jgi:hypothetical protein
LFGATIIARAPESVSRRRVAGGAADLESHLAR